MSSNIKTCWNAQKHQTFKGINSARLSQGKKTIPGTRDNVATFMIVFVAERLHFTSEESEKVVCVASCPPPLS